MEPSDEMLLRAVKRWQDENRERLEKQRARRGMRENRDLASLLKPLGREVKKNISHPVTEWQDSWVKTVGNEIAAATRISKIQNGFLIIEVDNPTLRTELEAYYSSELLEALKEERPDKLLRGLRFILGIRENNS